MNKSIKYLILITIFSYSDTYLHSQQWTQIGDNILGEGEENLLGYSIAMSGDGSTAAIGAPYQTNTGQVQVYNITDSGYSLKGSSISGQNPGENFGWAVSLSQDGNTIIIGAPAHIGNSDVYQWDGSDWIAKGNRIEGVNYDDHFGWDVDISSDGNVVAVSAPLSDRRAFNAGGVKIYTWNNNNWVGRELFGEETNEEFGTSIALSDNGETIVIGSPFGFGDYHPGLTKVFSLNGTQWPQQGTDIAGEGNTEHAGFSVDINNNGNRIAIGSFAGSSGKVRIFDWSSTAWTQVGANITGLENFEAFGSSLSLNGDGSIVAVGAPSNDSNGSNSGLSKIFTFNDNTWLQLGQDIKGDSQDDLGTAVALNDEGNRIAIGGAGNINNGDRGGRAKIFQSNAVTAVYDINKIDIIHLYPNPTHGKTTIELGQIFENIHVQAQSISGQLISSHIFKNKSNIDMDITGNAGWYILTIKTNKNITKRVKVYKSIF